MLDLEAIAGGATQLAALPVSALRLTTILATEDWLIADIVHTIEHDQALTGRLLRLANSAAAAGSGSVDTVRDAVMRMGTGPVLSMALSSAVKDRMAQSLESFEEEEGGLWRHSVAAALTVQLVGEFSKTKPPAESFVAGLLHDVGFLALDHWLTGMPTDAERDEARDSIQEADHGVLAGLIAAQWQLSEVIQEALVFHHRPSDAPTEKGREIAHFVALADCAARRIGAGFGQEKVRLDPTTPEAIGLSRKDFDSLCEQAQEQLAEFLELYG